MPVIRITRCHDESVALGGERAQPLLQSGRFKRSAFLHSAHTGGRAAVKHRPQRLTGAGSSPKTSNRRWRKCWVSPEHSGCMYSSLGWGSRCVFEDWTLRCRSFWWVYSGSGSSTARKPRWTCSRWAPSYPWSGSSSDAAWTPRASSSTAACASFTAGSKRPPSIRTNWKSSSSRLIRTRNTGRTFCRRCHGLRYLSKTDTKR